MYRIPIKIEGIERRKKSAGFLHIFAGLFLISGTSRYFKLSEYQNFLSFLPLYLVAFVSLAYGFLRSKLDPKVKYNHWMRVLQFLSFVVLGILMLQAKAESRSMMHLILASICILLLFTEKRVLHHTSLALEEKAVTVPGYFVNKMLPWETIENLIIRRDYITIYLSQNRYIQAEVLVELSEREIEDMNIFCQQQLNKKQTEPVQ
jgi:hypothetical protein